VTVQYLTGAAKIAGKQLAGAHQTKNREYAVCKGTS